MIQRHLLTTSHRHIDAQLKMANVLTPPLFPFVAEHNFTWYGRSLVSSDHLPFCVLTQPIVHSQSIYWESIVGNRNGLDIVQQKPGH